MFVVERNAEFWFWTKRWSVANCYPRMVAAERGAGVEVANVEGGCGRVETETVLAAVMLLWLNFSL